MQVVWFKRDLPIHDHAPLAGASVRGPCLCLYVYEPEIIHSEEFDASHLQFMNESLQELSSRLRDLGGLLTLRVGSMPDVLSTLHRDHGVDSLRSHEETGNRITYDREGIQQVGNQFPKYTIANLLRLTALLAGFLATVRLLGPQMSWGLFLVAYAFVPTIAMMICILLRRQSMAVRYGAAGLTLIVFATVMIILCGLSYGTDAMLLALLGTLIEWPGQAAILLCLHLIQRG